MSDVAAPEGKCAACGEPLSVLWPPPHDVCADSGGCRDRLFAKIKTSNSALEQILHEARHVSHDTLDERYRADSAEEIIQDIGEALGMSREAAFLDLDSVTRLAASIKNERDDLVSKRNRLSAMLADVQERLKEATDGR